MLSHFSRVWLFVTLWTVAHQAPLSVGFPRQEYWSGLPCPPPGDLPDQAIEPASLMSPALAGRFFTTSTIWHHTYMIIYPHQMMAMLGIAVCITMQKIVTEIHHLNNLKEKAYMMIPIDKKSI